MTRMLSSTDLSAGTGAVGAADAVVVSDVSHCPDYHPILVVVRSVHRVPKCLIQDPEAMTS